MDKPEIFMAPGPTPVPPEVLAAQAAPLVRATAVNFVANGTVAAGSSVDFRVTCVVRGLQHQTRWAGVVR